MEEEAIESLSLESVAEERGISALFLNKANVTPLLKKKGTQKEESCRPVDNTNVWNNVAS